MKGKRPRSQEIDVNSFHEEAVSSERTGRPVVETSVIQTGSSEDSMDPHVEMSHERTRRLVVENKHRKCAKSVSNTFLSWKRNIQTWKI